MVLQHVRLDETPATIAAHVRLLASVDASVFQQTVPVREILVANIARVRLIAVVRPLVQLQLIFSRECFRTFGTLEVFFSRVRVDMTDYFYFLRETLVANVAVVLLQALVYFHVSVVAAFVRELLGAFGAIVRFLPGVYTSVVFHVGESGEFFRAYVAAILFLARMG